MAPEPEVVFGPGSYGVDEKSLPYGYRPRRRFGHTASVRVVVLGSVGVLDAPSSVPTGEIARRVLAVLAAEANRPVHPHRVADLVWPGGERRGGNSLQAHISRWRKALGSHRITFSPAGYTLVVGTEELDALDFEESARAMQ